MSIKGTIEKLFQQTWIKKTAYQLGIVSKVWLIRRDCIKKKYVIKIKIESFKNNKWKPWKCHRENHYKKDCLFIGFY